MGRETADGRDGAETVALVGCPNVGKSVAFGELADDYVDVSNYPGTTVETTVATLDGYRLVDTPGVYGISSFSEEEAVTRGIVLDDADAVVNVVDATQLERDLFLTLQLLDMGVPTVVAVNMLDEAEADGREVDVDALAEALGVPVVPTVAVDGRGIDEIRSRVGDARAPAETGVERWYSALPDDLSATRAERTLLVEADEPTAARVRDRGDVVADGGMPTVDDDLREDVYAHRRSRVGDVVSAVVDDGGAGRRWGDRISDLLIRPATGTPIAVGLLAVIYYVIGDLVAQRLVDFVEGAIFAERYNPAVTALVGEAVPVGPWARPFEHLLVNGNLGLLTVTVQYVVGVLLPLVTAFYLAIGLLEDAGILPRLAVLTDRGLDRIGLNGRAVVPLIVGVGCVTMAVITTRMVGSRRERLISTALLGLAIPCSAQLGIIMGLLAGLGIGWWFAYLGVLLFVLGVAGTVLDRTLPGQQEALVTELPRLRVPRVRNVVRKTAGRAGMFLREAVPLFGVTAVAVSALDYVGGIALVERGLAPLTGFLGLPQRFGRVLVLGLIRRDFAAAGMTDQALATAETFVGLVVITLFVPCILSMTMILKERDARTGLVMWVGSWVVAFAVGGAVAAALGVVG
ncbi:ferrous iron transport protein B [Halostella litorea]|uniref:ferrous iron transport protein B n=1 Tax=Halostella litorea TaxID=2528831 RepID=UPI001092A9A8|nr:ferrous iron transport protein B [Halostella litorea]